MALELSFPNATTNPTCLVLQTLDLGENLVCKRSRCEIYSNTPSGIVEGADFNAVCMLPFAIAIRLIPLLQLLECVHRTKPTIYLGESGPKRLRSTSLARR